MKDRWWLMTSSGVDRGVSECRVDRSVAADAGGDVRRQPGAKGVSHEDSSEVVWRVTKLLVGGSGQSARGEGVVEAGVDVVAWDWSVLRAAAALEEERHRRTPEPFQSVVGGDQGHGLLAAPDAVDDRCQHLAEFRRDQQQPLLVELGWGDLQHGHDLAGSW
jgi:hypothetical protein